MIKLRIGDPMVRPGCRRREAPSKLVFSLGSRLEPAETLVYAVFDSLVVAGFEVQAGEISEAAPIPTLQGVLAAETNCGRYRFALEARLDNHKVFRHALADFSEELAVEVRCTPAA